LINKFIKIILRYFILIFGVFQIKFNKLRAHFPLPSPKIKDHEKELADLKQNNYHHQDFAINPAVAFNIYRKNILTKSAS